MLWKPKAAGDGAVVAPDERLPWPQTTALGLQHVVAMFGSTVLAPILMGFDPNICVLMSGVGTLIFFAVTGGKVPSYLGSSFAFISVVIVASAYGGKGPNGNIAVALGGIVAAGVLYAVIAFAVMAAGTRWIERLMPPVVTGSIVAVFANGMGLGKPVDGSAIANAAWLGAPHFTTPVFDARALVLIAPVALILVAENLGHLKAVAA